ncbi:ABC-2 and Plant PDR ABC-type transporter family protein [Heracleum sosnowskyi]|uniref:ABC-2 and Plant PDR ABC-type transporter family protein n=1 Tax=Heracleum sosnowskyi TaxID=360622 RepID=A0AAD8I9G5_9APIA|nr:ABC-2 and Plant PDR ABC-type transporter family protein [Heracleum sosnowskyi]
MMDEAEMTRASSFGSEREADELELQWAAIERLPTMKRVRMSLFDNPQDNGDEGKTNKKVVIDVAKLSAAEKHVFIGKLISNVEEDNARLLLKMKQRMDRVGLTLPAVEVRFRNVNVEAQCEVVHGKPLPTLWNTFKTIFSVVRLSCCKSQVAQVHIVKGVGGAIRPSRMTLLLGPPGCGKTTLLKALAGKLDKSLKVEGEVTYNGTRVENLRPQEHAAYISQYNFHVPEMTVRETIDFSARCQGVESRKELLAEVSRREKQAGYIPEADVDAYMKAISINGLEKTLQTDYILKILGLETCADTFVGSVMRRGISGGQKRRLATGEMIVSTRRVLFMDEISNEGKIVYHGARADVLKFFESFGFRCPERKGVSDYLQEVTSRKDQEQYWFKSEIPYRYVTVDEFSKKPEKSHLDGKIWLHDDELPSTAEDFQCDKNLPQKDKNNKYSMTKWQLFKACMDREVLLTRRNLSANVIKSTQLLIIAFIVMTTYIRTMMDIDSKHANYYKGCLFFGIMRIVTTGIVEMLMTLSRLTVFYKERDFSFYPAWAYAIPASLIKVPFSLLDSFLWTAPTYYVVGFSPGIDRFFCQFLLFFALHQASSSLFRMIASIFQSEAISTFCTSSSILIMMFFGGFIIPKHSIPVWLRWGFWLSPVSYAEIGLSLNEFHAPRWGKVTSGNLTIGEEALSNNGLNFESYYYWISVGVLFGFTLVFNAGFILALTYLKSHGTARAIISYDKLRELQQDQDCKDEAKRDNKIHMSPQLHSMEDTVIPEIQEPKKMVLPFEPLTLTFENVQYFVDTPLEMRKKGFKDKRLQLIHDMTGLFRPGILTALMVEESVTFSAFLRLPSQIDAKTRTEFVKDVLERVELDGIRNQIVGVPGRSGLSNEQRKRLTIAVELVSNPSIIFMDEPTSGLDARAAAIVMRTVKNVADTGRTVVCTIHQPSIDIFEAFDELILMKKGGEIIYSGPLGQHSSNLIDYFKSIPGILQIKENYNPATWMLEITTESAERQLGIDFGQVYKESKQFRDNIELVKELRTAPGQMRELHFSTRFARNMWEQYKACLWKQNLSYWRNPDYNVKRLCFMTLASVAMGALMWQKGKQIRDKQDLSNILSSIFIALQILGVTNCSSIIPVVATERTVLYREMFSGMYSSWAYSLAQVTIEFPYIFAQTLTFVIITYPAGMLMVSISPDGTVASTLAGTTYALLNLFSGFLIPRPAIPKWWIWLYWITPSSWMLYGALTSQYGDNKEEITSFRKTEEVKSFLEDYYGYHYDFLGVVAVVVATFPLLAAFLFAYFISKLNFQRR